MSQRARSHNQIFGPDAPAIEWDSFTCRHCQATVDVPPRADAAALGGVCKQCMGLICPRCVGRAERSIPSCTTWAERMDRAEKRERFLRSAGIFEPERPVSI